jgi:hypothetical protein
MDSFRLLGFSGILGAYHLYPETVDRIRVYLRNYVEFICENGFAKPGVLERMHEQGDHFELRSNDVTELGLEFSRAAMDKWIGRSKPGSDPSDIRPLERALKKFKAVHGL